MFCFVLFIPYPAIWRGVPPLPGDGRSFDAKPLIEQGGVFLPLRNEDFFCTHLTVLNDAVAGDMDGTRDPRTCIDLDPCEMYESCPIGG